MGDGCCGAAQKVTYVCAANPKGCSAQQVPANQPVPTCCGQPMKQQVAKATCG